MMHLRRGFAAIAACMAVGTGAAHAEAVWVGHYAPAPATPVAELTHFPFTTRGHPWPKAISPSSAPEGSASPSRATTRWPRRRTSAPSSWSAPGDWRAVTPRPQLPRRWLWNRRLPRTLLLPHCGRRNGPHVRAQRAKLGPRDSHPTPKRPCRAPSTGRARHEDERTQPMVHGGRDDLRSV